VTHGYAPLPYVPGDLHYEPSGWRCPGCGRCYGPQIAVCFYCPGQGFTVTNSVTVSNRTHEELE
jgi:uncharacterized OB-fold protein